MHLHQHLALSTVVGGGLVAATGEPELVGITVAAGVLPDADHAIDFANWYLRGKTDRLILFLHGWEYLALAAGLYLFAFTEPWMAAVAIGYATQIVTDQLFNQPRWNTYFLTVRATRGFRWQGVIRRRPADSAYLSLMASIPIFREPIASWFERRVMTMPERASNVSAGRHSLAPGRFAEPGQSPAGDGD